MTGAAGWWISRSSRFPTTSDFELEFLNEASVRNSRHPGTSFVGARICEVYPAWRSSVMFDRYREVVEGGEPFVADRVPYEDVLPDGAPISGYRDLQVVKLGDGYMAASRDVTDVVRAEETLRLAEETAERECVAVGLLQRAALPTQLPTFARATVGAHYQPAAEQPIGGDWYDAFRIDGHKIALVIADVAGHGPDAAAFMVQIRNVVRTAALGQFAPDDILRLVNHVVLSLHEDGTPLTTCCLAMLDLDSLELSRALAGHPPPLIVTPDGLRPVPHSDPGLPLGVDASAVYAVCTSTVGDGDRIVMYTDGLIERRDESIALGIERLGVERLGRAIMESRDQDPQHAAEWLATTISPQLDDVALLVVDVGPVG